MSDRVSKPKYPRYAREAFPILIEKAIKKEGPISYAKLADSLSIKSYGSRDIHIGLNLACMSTKLYELEQIRGEKFPRLTNIVFSENCLTNPDNYIVKGWRKLYNATLSWTDYEDKILAPIHAYENWEQVLNWMSELIFEQSGISLFS